MTSGGVTLAVRRRGYGQRLVALHGGPGLDHRLLLPLAGALSDRLTVWLPDLPGHGDSGPPEGVAGLDDLVNPLGRWLAALEGDPPVLLGHSMGAFLLRELLRWNRVRPPAAVLVSPPASAGRRLPEPQARTAGPPAPAAGGAPDDDRWRRRARAELRSQVRRESRGAARSELLATLESVRVQPPWAYGELVGDLQRASAQPVRRFDPGCPVLVVVGERDRTTPVVEAARTVEEIRGARLVRLAGRGHFPVTTAPEEVVTAVLAFLEECGLPAPGSSLGAR